MLCFVLTFDLNSELKTAVQPHIKQEDEGKFRCRTCNKLFKAMAFVEKHVQTKHGELIKSVMDEVRASTKSLVFLTDAAS
jgi:uncharacterized C2H2 Zn-finger protein